MSGPVEPNEEQMLEVARLAAEEGGGPVVMLNLNRYSDRDEYVAYTEVAEPVLERLGGRVLWHATSPRTVIGTDDDRYDEIIAVWYPSARAFVELATDPDVLEARRRRVAGLERATLIWCDSGEEPVLSGDPPAHYGS